MKFKKLLLAAAICTSFMLPTATAGNDYGSFAINMSEEQISAEQTLMKLNDMFGDNGNFKFIKVREYRDASGMTHTEYKQYYQGQEVEGCMILVHSRNGKIVSMNGQGASIEQMPAEVHTRVSKDAAIATARRVMNLNAPKTGEAETLLARVESEDGVRYQSATKVRVSSIEEMTDYNVYIDAEKGTEVKRVNMLPMAAPVKLDNIKTMYAGEQSIHVDKNDKDEYTLTDKSRTNYTLNARNAQCDRIATEAQLPTAIQQMIDSSEEYTSAEGNWDLCNMMINVDSISTEWNNGAGTITKNYYYIITKDGKEVANTLYDRVRTKPPFSFNLDIFHRSFDFEAGDKMELSIYIYSANGDDVLVSQCAFEAGKPGDKVTFGEDSVTANISFEEQANPACDVHYAVEKVYDYYKEVHGRNSYDNNGAPVYQLLNIEYVSNNPFMSALPNNAFAWAQKPHFIAIGSGDMGKTNGNNCRPFVSLDLLGHEYTHLVMLNNGRGGLNTQGEPGALNEAVADCFAACIDFYVGEDPNWQIAEDIMIQSPNMRDMSNPKMSGGGSTGYMVTPQPDTYEGEYWMNPHDLNQDFGGIHVNNGVFNYWFYLVCEGGQGENDHGYSYDVKGITIEKGREVLYKTLMDYIIPAATFMDARNATLLAAQDLFGESSEDYKSVCAAWEAVGIEGKVGVDEITDESKEHLKLYSKDGNLMVETEPETRIEVYSVMGMKLYDGEAESETTTISGLGEQVVIVKAGNAVEKAIIKK